MSYAGQATKTCNFLLAQIARLERYCLNKGMPILNTYSFDESAYSNDRSEFDRIIDIVLSQTEKVAFCTTTKERIRKISRNLWILEIVEKAAKE